MSERLHVLNPNYINVGIESISDAVEAVEINPQLDEFVSEQDYPHLFDENWIIQQCAVHTTPPHDWVKSKKEPNQQRNIITPSIFGRALTLCHTPMVYGGDTKFVARQLYAKGIGPSGYHYRNILKSIKYSYLIGDITDSEDPIGYFGYKDAKKEITIGNHLLKHNCRVQLPVAILKLDHQRLLSVATKQWKDYSRISEDVISVGIQKVLSHSDQLAIVVRSGNSANRLDTLNTDRNFLHSSIKIGVQSFIDELKLVGKHSDHPYCKYVEDIDLLKSALTNLRSGTHLHPVQQDQYMLFLNGLFEYQAWCFTQAHNDTKSQYEIFPGCGTERDTDFSLFETDWELTERKNRDFVFTNYDAVHTKLISVIQKTYLNHLLSAELISYRR